MRLWNPTSQPIWLAPGPEFPLGWPYTPGFGRSWGGSGWDRSRGLLSPLLALGSYHPGAPIPWPDRLTNSSCLGIWEGA